jgi:phosphate starvation-inducible PhoH-like protein
MARNRTKRFKPKTPNQTEYARDIAENDITFCIGPAGSGKTAVAVGMATDYYKDEKVQKIIITRPIVETGKGLGYLPGDLNAKVHPYMRPLLEELNIYLGRDVVRQMIYDEVIEVAPLPLLRGRNFHNAFVILDEAQNADRKQLKMFLTRIGRETKMVINGDTDQYDLIGDCDLLECFDRLAEIPSIGLSELGHEDIIRHPIIGPILNALDGF